MGPKTAAQRSFEYRQRRKLADEAEFKNVYHGGGYTICFMDKLELYLLRLSSADSVRSIGQPIFSIRLCLQLETWLPSTEFPCCVGHPWRYCAKLCAVVLFCAYRQYRIQSKAVGLETWRESGKRSTWPARRRRLSVTMALNCLTFARLKTFSLVTRSLHEIFIIFLKHLWWKTFSWCEMLAVFFQVSQAYIAVGMTMDTYSLILVSKLIRFRFHTQLRRLKTLAAFPIRVLTSTEESPSFGTEVQKALTWGSWATKA